VSKNKAMGKGVDALFGDIKEINSTNYENNETNETEINIDQIETNPEQPRKHFDEEKLEELVESIRSKGILQPILFDKSETGYCIVAGERRYRAAKLAGLKSVPGLVRSFTHEEKLEIALIENIQREDLSPVEEALAYKNLINELEINQEEAAKRVGKKRSTVANSLRLLKLPENMLESLDKGEITSGHARALLSIVNPSDQKILFSRIKDQSLSVREAEKMSGDLNNGSRASSSSSGKKNIIKKQIPELQSIQQKFIDFFGTKVQMKGSLNKGKIEINYYSPDDLDRIYEILDK